MKQKPCSPKNAFCPPQPENLATVLNCILQQILKLDLPKTKHL